MARKPNDDFFSDEPNETGMVEAPEDGAEAYGPEPQGGSTVDFLPAEPDVDDVEPFVPTDFYPSAARVPHRRRRSRHKRRVIWAVLLCLGVILLCVGGAYAYTLLTDPSSMFETGAATPTPKPGTAVINGVAGEETPAITPTPTIDPYQLVYEQADTSMMQNIVNVLLIGVDYAEERESWSGKHEYHADVMMIMAINFDENRVDLISLPRDTYAKIPGVKGIYKLNASLNCGGGYDAEGGAGFLKTCEAASWMIGGIPINYYYAVTMPAVKQLVDAIGGVDYNLELDFKMAGRSYAAGPQHMNGQAVLDYLRVRKNVQGSGDANRVNRQKKMLIALFSTMQDQNLILKIPDILNSFSGQLYTNCTLGQTAALTAFAYKLSRDDIGMYSMGGKLTNIFNWNFCLTDQTNRVKIIKTVYDIDAPRYLQYTADYAEYRWADMLAKQYLETVRRLTDYVSAEIAADDLLPTASPSPTLEPTPPPTDVPIITPETTPEPTPETVGGTAYRPVAPLEVVRLAATGALPATRGEEVQQYSIYQRELFNEYLNSLDALEEARAVAKKQAERYADGKSNDLEQATQELSDYASHVKTNALNLAQEFGYSTSKFVWTYWFDRDRDFNEVAVDFR